MCKESIKVDYSVVNSDRMTNYFVRIDQEPVYKLAIIPTDRLHNRFFVVTMGLMCYCIRLQRSRTLDPNTQCHRTFDCKSFYTNVIRDRKVQVTSNSR